MKKQFRAKAGESFFNCMIEGTEEEIKDFEKPLEEEDLNS
jgi:hypothetical protein